MYNLLNVRKDVIFSIILSLQISPLVFSYFVYSDSQNKQHVLFSLSYLVVSFMLLLIIILISKRIEDIFEVLTNKTPEILFVKDKNGKFVYGNQKLLDLYNTKLEELIGEEDYKFTKDFDSSKRFKESLRKVIKNFAVEKLYESSVNVKTGEVRYYKSTKVPFLNFINEPLVLVSAVDITEVELLKRKLEESNNNLEAVLDVSEQGLWEWNTNTNKVSHNNHWRNITGIKESDESFKEFEDCILDEDKSNVLNAITDLMDNGVPYSIEFRIKKKDGSVVWVWDRGEIAKRKIDGTPLLVVGVIQDVTELVINRNRVNNLAYYDQLTKLANRTRLEICLEDYIKNKERKYNYISVIFLDLDKFKFINDAYGHNIGDELLKIISQRIGDIKNENAIISRFGGDEFVLVIPSERKSFEKVYKETKKYSEKLINEISKNFKIVDEFSNINIDYSISASLGGVIFKPNTISKEKSLKLADIALYRSKSHHDNIPLIYNGNRHKELEESFELQKSIYNSLNFSDDFYLNLQPKFNKKKEVIGAEALVRWKHPKLGEVLPYKFIPLAEESNLILPLGKLIIEKSCEVLAQWKSVENTKNFKLAINISTKQLLQSTFEKELCNIIDCYDVSINNIILEVTESILLQDVNDAKSKLNRLKNKGFTISLDDFGTGYSSLNYLKSLPIDELKIDRSFVETIITDKKAHSLVKSIIDLSENFGLVVVAEGVENQEQFNLLSNYNVNYYQGYLFDKPMKTEEFNNKYQNS